MKKYPKAFEDWYLRADTYLGVQRSWMHTEVKRKLYNAWKAGRRHQKSTTDEWQKVLDQT